MKAAERMAFQPNRRSAGRDGWTGVRPGRGLGDLTPVMREICALMHGKAAMLALYAGDGAKPRALFADPALDQAWVSAMLEIGTDVRTDFQDGVSFWRAAPDGRSILFLPIERADGPERCVILVMFEVPDEKVRRRAERIYRERRPLAIGYFHLWQANRALAQRSAALEAVLDRLTVGVILLDGGGRIAMVNRTATEILELADGLGVTHGVLRATHLADGVMLQAALAHAAPVGGSGDAAIGARLPLLSFRRRGAPPLLAALLPSPQPRVQASDIATIMYVVDPALDLTAALQPLCRIYGLSPVETMLASLLARGEPLGVAAAAMRIKEQTARSYLKSIFIKTATNRQAELVHLLLSSLIRTRHDALFETIEPRSIEA